MKIRLIALTAGLIGLLQAGGATPQSDTSVPGLLDREGLKIIRAVDPEIPAFLRKSSHDEKVIADFTVTAEGTVENIHIVYTNHPKLAEVVREALAQWKFEPLVKEGETVAQRVRIPILFHRLPK